MKIILKLLVYLVALGGVGLVVYTYVGPFFGADFSPPATETRIPVTLEPESNDN